MILINHKIALEELSARQDSRFFVYNFAIFFFVEEAQFPDLGYDTVELDRDSVSLLTFRH